jgi:S-disulfanyl-L-cysteine oxidoreductase SoxD
MRSITIAGGTVVLAAAGALLYPLLAAEGAGIFPYTDPDVVAQGRTVYADHCAACHGANLEGQPDWRRPDAAGYLPAPPHDETGHTWHHADPLLFEITKYGTEAVVGGGYRSNMQGFGDVLSDEEIIAALAYIKSTWPPRIIERHDALNADAAAFSQ